MLTLTLDGQPVDLPADAAVALSYRSSDLRRLDTREAAFSETFALPLTANNARVLGTPHALTSQTRAPYRRLPAVLRANGVPVLRGVGVLDASEAGYELTLLDDTADLFGRVGERQLRELDLSAYDHARTYADIKAASTPDPAQGYVYALADTGRLASAEAGGRIAATEVPASVYEAAVLRALVAGALPGYALTGSLLSDPLWLSAVLPAAYSVPRLREAYLAPYRVQAGAPADVRYFDIGIGTGDFRGQAFTVLFAQQVSGAPTAFTGAAHYYGPGHLAQIDVRGRLFVRSATIHPIYIRLMKGAGATQGFADVLWEQRLKPSFQGVVEINVNLPAYSETSSGRLFLQLFNGLAGREDTDITVLAGSAVTFAVAPPALLGAPVHLETTLPDISQADYLKLVLNRFNVALRVDAAARTVQFALFNDLERRRNEAVDWTHKLDHSARPRLDYRLSGYAQRNTFVYKEAPEAYAPLFGMLTPAQVRAQIGAADVLVPDETLPPLAEAYAAPVVLPLLRAIAGGTASVAWLPTAAEADPADPRVAVPWIFGGTYRKNDQVTLFGRAWVCQTEALAVKAQPGDLANRADWSAPAVPDTQVPAVAVVVALDAAAPSLFDEQLTSAAPASFRATAGLSNAGLSFTELLPAYHEGTARILGRVQLLTDSVLLHPTDIAALDFSRPVYLNVRYRAGYGALRGWFYLNLVDQYRPGQSAPVRCELLKLGDPIAGLAPAATPPPVRPSRLLLTEAGQPLASENTQYLTEEA